MCVCVYLRKWTNIWVNNQVMCQREAKVVQGTRTLKIFKCFFIDQLFYWESIKHSSSINHKSIHTIQTMPYNTSHKQIPLCQKNLLQIDSNKILHMKTHYTLDEISFKNIYNDTYMTHLKNAIYTKKQHEHVLWHELPINLVIGNSEGNELFYFLQFHLK